MEVIFDGRVGVAVTIEWKRALLVVKRGKYGWG